MISGVGEKSFPPALPFETLFKKGGFAVLNGCIAENSKAFEKRFLTKRKKQILFQKIMKGRARGGGGSFQKSPPRQKADFYGCYAQLIVVGFSS